MLINGKPASIKDLDTLMEELNGLPTGFSCRNTNIMDTTYDSDNDSYKHHCNGMETYEKWQKTKESHLLEEALQHFKSAAEASEHEGNPVAQANDLSNYGGIARLANRSEDGILAFEKALEIYKNEGDINNTYRDLGCLHEAIRETTKQKDTAGLTEEAGEFRQRLRPLRKQSINIAHKRNGESGNPKAYRVEQGEIGFSSDQPIGTDNVNDCICIIIRDPNTQKTALAHVDVATDIQSLQNVFDRLPTNSPLQARLIGARFADDPNTQNFEFKNSIKNIKKISGFLGNHNIEVLSADLLNQEQPTSIVVDPKTFEITEEIADIKNPNMYLSNAKPIVKSWGTPLHIAFDLTVSKERVPVILNKSAVKTLRNRYVGKTDDQIYEYFDKNYQFSDKQFPNVVEHVILLAEAYENSLEYILDKLNKKIISLAENGIEISNYSKYMAIETIQNGEIHLGEGAELANQPLVDFIENKLFTIRDDMYISDINGLSNFHFPEQPYEMIEKSIKNPESFQAKLTQEKNTNNRGQGNAL